jgi:ribosome-associated heat shock protein Hsp15
VKRGDEIVVKKEGFLWTYKVVDIIANRVSATLAQPCYENLTSEEELNKYKAWFNNKAANEMREAGTGRPTKRDRRDIDKFKEI